MVKPKDEEVDMHSEILFLFMLLFRQHNNNITVINAIEYFNWGNISESPAVDETNTYWCI